MCYLFTSLNQASVESMVKYSLRALFDLGQISQPEEITSNVMFYVYFIGQSIVFYFMQFIYYRTYNICIC